MDKRVGPLVATLELNTKLFENCLDGVDDETGLSRTNDRTNHLRFIAAHMVGARAFLAGVLGGDGSDPFEAQLGAAKSIEEVASFPTVDEIRARWPEVSRRATARLEALTPEELDAATEYGFPVEDRSVLGIATFLVQHDTYHLGQLGLLPKHVGLGAMAYR